MPATATAPADLSDLDDPELLDRAQSGDPRAQRAALERHRDGLIAFAVNKFGLDQGAAEDVVQDSLMQAYRHLYRFDENRAKWSTWLFSIVANRAKNERRNRSRRADGIHYSDLESEDGRSMHEFVADPEARADGRTRRRRLRKLLREAAEKLKLHHRVVFVLREFENRTYGEIEEAVGIGMGTVKSRLSRARNEFREALEQLDPEIAEEYAADRRTKRPPSWRAAAPGGRGR